MPNTLEKTPVQEHGRPQSSTPGFPLVGIGASAGGLEAITELLSNLTTDCGMALLVVQHLDPDHASMLTEILARKTTMPVIEATENQLIEKNQVYVIPPNASMTVTQGRLTLKSRESIPGIPMPVDDLFYSLANDQGANAIGISLSGSGSDGALGMQAIKGEGGITFAQNDSSAKFNSMPRAAVSMGCVDFVLSPKEIAEELVRIGQHPITNHPLLLNTEKVAADEENLGKIFQILDAACKHDFTHYKRGTLTRRLTRRIALLNLNSLDEYIRFLKSNPDEVQALYQDLLIRVTSFFRDPDAFEGLVKKVFPTLVERCAPDEAIRIWVPGCSTGEEVYSIAICLLEYLNERAASTKIQIFGTDVSESALSTARVGIYFESIANEVSEARLKRFFSKVNGQYHIAKSLRNLCVFANQNVTCDPPFSQLDLISCRNVLIYFDPVLQKRVISLFHYALKPGGCLILGPSETIGASSDIFTLTHEKKFNIFTKRSVPKRPYLDYLNGGEKPKSTYKQTHKPFAIGHPEKQKREIDRIALARYVPAGILCDDELNILEFRGDTGPYLLQPSGPPSTNLRQLARLGLFVEISNMIDQARKEAAPVLRTAQRVEMQDGIREVDLEVIPITQKDAEISLFLVFFEQPSAAKVITVKHTPNLWSRLKSAINGGGRIAENDNVVQRLQLELDATRQYIRTMAGEHSTAQEELKASQEELLSSNEEFQSTNEELETAKEELQSSNEELITTNDELMHRNQELNSLNVELEHARNYAQAIVETVRDPLVVLDENLRIVRTNAAFHFTFKLTPRETVGCLFDELDDQQWDLPELRQLLSEVLPKDRAFENCEITSKFSKIGGRTMMLNGKHLAWENQTLILLAIEDVTDYKAAQDALKEAAKRKDEFLAMLAHELRNPLAPMRNALEILRRGDAGQEAEHQAHLIMDRQLRKETRLIDDLLDTARITQGSIVLKTEWVDLKQITAQAVEGTKHHYEERRHNLKMDLPDSEVIIEGDPLRLEQIISNLLTNAAKYTEPGGHIILKLEIADGQAVLRIVDNGIGINAEMLPRIFDLFVQAEVALDRSQGGLGIGLTLVRRLVKLQGGTVEVNSRGTNQGSEFIVRFPMVPGARLADIESLSPTASVLPKNLSVICRRIMVVDDNLDSANTIALLLQLEGQETKAAYGGPAALEMVREFKPEIILMDIGLPGMDGYEVARRIRDMPDQSKTLLIAVSGYSPLDERARNSGIYFDHYLLKPVDFDQLRMLIARFCAKDAA
jgi:two-component system CheB/CheR fusion protein